MSRLNSWKMIAETAAWLDLLYGKCQATDGQLAVVNYRRNSLVGLFDVGTGDRLVRAARAMQESPGCYLKINLMDGQAIRRRSAHAVGNRDEVKTIVALALDVDAGKESYPSRSTALWALEQMPKPPTLVINSGGEASGFHCYWVLRSPHRIGDDRAAIQKQAKCWQQRLKALVGGRLDSTANLDRVLRCVGVPRLDGRQVTCHEYHPERLYGLDELR